MQAKILVVDDEKGIVDLLRKFLATEGFAVEAAYDGPSAVDSAFRSPPDLVLLDVMLPGLDGLEVLKKLREKTDVPVIMLTARADEVDRVLGLGLGADDYVTKPFSLRELALRIKAILRRFQSSPESSPAISVGGLILDPERMEVTVNDCRVQLTRAEFMILRALFSRPGKVFTREELLNAAFGEVYEGYERTIDTHVWNLRRKIEKDPSNPKYVLTVFGVGYKGGTGE